MAGSTAPKWDDRYYVGGYALARCGRTDNDIAKAWGVDGKTIANWRRARPAFDEALEMGRSESGAAGMTMSDYVYGRLPEKLQDVWDRLDLCNELPNPLRHIERILKDCGEREQQRLFLYALVHTGFDASEACRRLNVPKYRLDSWAKHDPAFLELYKEIHWHKGNFFERQLVQLVEQGDPAAVLHVNRTFNRARGYGDVKKVEKEVSGKVDHSHTHRIMKVKDLSLPVEVLVQLAEAMEKRLGVIDGGGERAAEAGVVQGP